MQALFEIGEEMGEHEGLGLLKRHGGEVCRYTVSEDSAYGVESTQLRKKRCSLIRSKMGRMSISITRIIVRREIHLM
jgi:hypothetical protein